MEILRSTDGSEIGIVAATWELNPKVTFDSLADEFKRNPSKAWRNYGSVISTSIDAAIKEPDAVLRRVNLARPSPWDLRLNQFAAWFAPRYGTRYFLHFDLSRNRDATGVALCHREKNGVLVVDFMLQHRAIAGKNINFAELRERYVYPLVAKGFHLQCVSFDGFQSDETRQVLEERGLHTDHCSADKSTDAYDTLIEYLFSDKLDFYSYPVFTQEFEELRLIDGRKYDHPKRFKNGAIGSKDVADAVACSGLMAVRYELENPVEAPGKIKVFRSKAITGLTYGERTAW
jgi:hypothetical protein